MKRRALLGATLGALFAPTQVAQAVATPILHIEPLPFDKQSTDLVLEIDRWQREAVAQAFGVQQAWMDDVDKMIYDVLSGSPLRALVTNQTDPAMNGVYTVSHVIR
jgi:hypothetical protein